MSKKTMKLLTEMLDESRNYGRMLYAEGLKKNAQIAELERRNHELARKMAAEQVSDTLVEGQRQRIQDLVRARSSEEELRHEAERVLDYVRKRIRIAEEVEKIESDTNPDPIHAVAYRYIRDAVKIYDRGAYDEGSDVDAGAADAGGDRSGDVAESVGADECGSGFHEDRPVCGGHGLRDPAGDRDLQEPWNVELADRQFRERVHPGVVRPRTDRAGEGVSVQQSGRTEVDGQREYDPERVRGDARESDGVRLVSARHPDRGDVNSEESGR